MNPLSQPSPSVSVTEYESVAYWPDSVSLMSADNTSTDKHATYEQADAVCMRLRREGLGGERKIFPLKTLVRPVDPSPPPIDAHVACADGVVTDATNGNHAENAGPAGLAKLDDHGRGGFIVEGGYCIDKQERKRGPVAFRDSKSFPVVIDDIHGRDTFTMEGLWIDDGCPGDMDLVAPWIDWKAECEKLAKLSQDLCDLLNENIPSRLDEIEWESIRALESHLATLKGEGGRA